MNQTVDMQEYITAHRDVFNTKPIMLSAGVAIRAHGDKKGIIVDNQYSLTDMQYLDFTSSIGIPRAYANKVPVDLLLDGIEWSLKNSTSPALQVNAKGDVAGFGIDKYPLRVEEMCDAVSKITGSTQISTISHADNKSMTIYAPTSMIAVEPKIGDTVSAGLAFSADKRLNIGSAHIYTHRLACLNGAVVSSKSLSWSKGKLDFPQFFNHVEMSFKKNADLALQFVSALPNTKVHDLGQLDKLLAEYSTVSPLSERIREIIKEQILAAGVSDMYDIWNVITAYATHGGHTNTGRMNLLKYGGAMALVAGSEKHHCGRCGNDLLHTNN